MTMPEYLLDTITFGGITRRAVHAPSRNYNGNPKRGIDGILAYGFFAGCLLTLDYAQNEVRVGPGHLKRDRGTIAYASDEGGPGLPIHIGRIRTTANLDTGDDESFTLPGRLSSELRFAGTPHVVGKAQSANNAYEIREAPLVGKIRLGQVQWTDPVVSFSDVFDNINLGSRALQRMTITFDQTKRLVRLTQRK